MVHESNARQPVIYKPLAERIPDTQHRDLMKKIMETGEEKKVIQGQLAKTIRGHAMRFDMSNGFPVETLRDLSGGYFNAALAEHTAFLNGVHTHAELSAWGCKYWDRWVTKEKCDFFNLPEGDLGRSSYGPAWTRFPTNDGREFDQILNIVQQIKARPFLRTHEITPWIPFMNASGNPDYKRQVVVAPCHGWIHVHVNEEKKELQIEHRQRSADVPVGLCFNMAQYASFGMMLAHLLQYTFTELIYWITDAHIYESQYPYVEELLSREVLPYGIVTIDTSVTNIKAFRPEHFILSEYSAGKRMNIPTPV